MSILRAAARCIRDRGGGVAIFFALALPVVAVLAVGAVDLASVNTDRQRTQDVADSVALSAAKQLGLADPNGVTQRSDLLVKSQLEPLKDRFNFTVRTVPAEDGSSVTVIVDGRRTSFFGNLLPPGGWKVHVEATASQMGMAPLCVLTSGKSAANKLDMKGGSQLKAGECLVHANSDIGVESTAWLQAEVVQASGLAAGRITPSPQQSAPAIQDPFAGMAITMPGSLCLPVDLILQIGLNILTPGVHCANYKARKNTTLRLMPGEHYFRGRLELSKNAVLQGTDVVLVFDDKSQFAFTDSSKVDLSGRRTGPFAGFVLATTRKNTGEFVISSDNARHMVGTIYIPSATLSVTGKGNSVADQSPWTVVVARDIKMSGSPKLVINADYDDTHVPVPSGVGPTGGSVKLTE